MTFLAETGKLVVYDTEFTSWPGFRAQGYKAPGRYPEIIQIGAVKLDAASLEECDAFEIFVQPRVNPVLRWSGCRPTQTTFRCRYFRSLSRKDDNHDDGHNDRN